MSQKFGIDVSHWQGSFDFARAKSKEGVEFAVIKAGGADAGLYKDSQFEANYKKCEECGLPKGAYFYGNARSVADAKKEAEYFLSLLKGKRYEYPVFYDVEGSMITKNDRNTLTQIVKAFCSAVEAAGYWVGIYSSESFFKSEMNDGELTRYSHWVARWGKSNGSSAVHMRMSVLDHPLTPLHIRQHAVHFPLQIYLPAEGQESRQAHPG